MKLFAFVALLLSLFFSTGCCDVHGVTQSGSPAPYTGIALDVIEEIPPCNDVALTGDIYWYQAPTGDIEKMCGRPVMGCAEVSSCQFSVWVSDRYPPLTEPLPVWKTALVNEIGYWMWFKCYGYIGEKYVNGEEVLDPGLAAWIQTVNKEVEIRATALSGSVP